VFFEVVRLPKGVYGVSRDYLLGVFKKKQGMVKTNVRTRSSRRLWDSNQKKVGELGVQELKKQVGGNTIASGQGGCRVQHRDTKRVLRLTVLSR